MTVQNRFIYKLKDRLGTLVVVPLGESEFTIDYDRENEEKISYKISLSGKIKFVKAAFRRIMEMETSVYRCDEQVLTIYKICNGVEKEVFSGKISLNQGEFDLDRCEVVLKFIEDNSDKCYNDNKGAKVNLFQIIYNRILAQTASYNGVIETKVCSASGVNATSPFIWCGTGQASDGNWIATKASASSPDGMRRFANTTWKREIIEIDCSETPEPDWVLVEDNCSTTGKKKFAKAVTLINCSSYGTNPDENGAGYSYNYNCDVLGYDGGLTTLRNGVLFKDVMIQLLNAVCPDLTLKSDFFQINPDNISGTNYVTGKASKVNNIVIFQKSDVKRPTDQNFASKLEITLEDMLEILLKMFNVKWRIVGNVFRLEHVSYFSKSVGIDVTTEDLKKYFSGNRKYSYESEKIPAKEIFKFKEQQGADWNLEVIYSGCVSNDAKNEVSNLIDNAMTDVVFAMNNPEPDNKFVDDKGFVLVSTRKVGTQYYINSEASTNGSRLNNVFAWVQLFRDYHYYERPMKTGKVNGVLTEFITTIPTKKGERFAIPLDICSTFNPDNFIKTALGNGIISSGKYKFKDSMLELELLYESNQNLIPNIPPTLDGGGVYQTYEGIAKFIDIIAEDSDGFITTINVIYPPSNGVVEIISFSQIKYTPNAGFTGFDFFSLQAVDNISEVSNIENFGIEVLPENLPPIARDDEYFLFIGDAWFQSSSIFANDTDEYNLIELVTPNVTSNEGVNITIDNNGFFDYVPPVGFEGTDFFSYTIKDDLNQQSTAIVRIRVLNKQKPVGVGDFYQTLKNTILNVNGSQPNKLPVIANDYTPDGIDNNYTVTAETKPTLHGGNVSITSDGKFTFTPLTDFQGIDEFEYTVSNSFGSGTGVVKVSVLPNIYVKITYNNETSYGVNGSDGYFVTRDYYIECYEDSAGLIPFDGTDMNFKVLIKEKTNFPHGSTTTYFETSILSGVSTKILSDFTFYSIAGGQGTSVNLTIENGSYLIII